MNRTESQSAQATNATAETEEAPASTTAPTTPKKHEPIKSTARDVAGFGVQLGVLGRTLKYAEVEGPLTPEQRAAIEKVITGLENLSKLCAEHFGVSDHFGGEDL